MRLPMVPVSETTKRLVDSVLAKLGLIQTTDFQARAAE
jgi:hypothetical protein